METPLEQTSLERSELQAEHENIGAIAREKCFALSDFADALDHLNNLARKRSTHRAARPREEELASSSCLVAGAVSLVR